MKRFIPDVKNNVCTVDVKGITPLMQCGSPEECFYYCDRFNEDEKDDKQRGSSINVSENKDRIYN